MLRRSTAPIVACLLLACATPAAGHVQTRSGPVELTMGWGHEPALSGSENYVEVAVTDRSGTLKAPVVSLEVEVSFGGAVTALPLVPADAPGEFRAVLIPTRAGTYGFHVTGRVSGRRTDAESTCSGRTFDCVTDPKALQFPAKDPSAGEIAQRLERALPRADAARDSADNAKTVALIALIAAVLGLVAALAIGLRVRRKAG